jgi:hypothetical protein
VDSETYPAKVMVFFQDLDAFVHFSGIEGPVRLEECEVPGRLSRWQYEIIQSFKSSGILARNCLEPLSSVPFLKDCPYFNLDIPIHLQDNKNRN